MIENPFQHCLRQGMPCREDVAVSQVRRFPSLGVLPVLQASFSKVVFPVSLPSMHLQSHCWHCIQESASLLLWYYYNFNHIVSASTFKLHLSPTLFHRIEWNKCSWTHRTTFRSYGQESGVPHDYEICMHAAQRVTSLVSTCIGISPVGEKHSTQVVFQPLLHATILPAQLCPTLSVAQLPAFRGFGPPSPAYSKPLMGAILQRSPQHPSQNTLQITYNMSR